MTTFHRYFLINQIFFGMNMKFRPAGKVLLRSLKNIIELDLACIFLIPLKHIIRLIGGPMFLTLNLIFVFSQFPIVICFCQYREPLFSGLKYHFL